MAAARACQLDRRIIAGMNQDADYEGFPFPRDSSIASIRQPFLFFATSHSLYATLHTIPPTDGELTQWKMTRSSYDSMTFRWQENQDRSLAAMPGGSYRIRAE